MSADEPDEELDWEAAAAADALLRAIAGGPEAEVAPEWLGRIGGRTLVGVLDGPGDPAPVVAGARAVEARGNRTLFAMPVAEDPEVAEVVLRARRWAAGGGLAALALDLAAIEGGAVFGPAVDEAERVFRAAGAAGVWVSPAVHRCVGGPAEPGAAGARLPALPSAPARSRPWVGFAGGFLAAAAATLFLVLPGASEGPPGLGGELFVTAQVKSRGGAGLRADDVLDVTLTGAAGTFGTLLLLDSAGELSAPAPHLVGAPLSPERSSRASLVLDDRPGTELFLALITAEALDPARLGPLLREANGAPGRGARVAGLRAALKRELGAAWELREGHDIQHVE